MIINFDNTLINLLENTPEISIQGKSYFYVFTIDREDFYYNHIHDEFTNYYVISGYVSTEVFFDLYNICVDLKVLGIKSKLLLKSTDDYAIYIDFVFEEINKVVIDTFNRYSYEVEYNYFVKVDKTIIAIKENTHIINEYIVHLGIEINYEASNEYFIFIIYPFSLIFEGKLITLEKINLLNEYLTLININEQVIDNISFYITNDKIVDYTLFLELCNKLNVYNKMKIIFNTKILYK